MNKHKCFSVIGGDDRSIEAANKLFSSGFAVKVFAFNEDCHFANGIVRSESLTEALSNAEYILLPLPYSTDNETINTPLYEKTVKISSLFDAVKENQMVFAGKINDTFLDFAKRKSFLHSDYSLREEFAILNAIPTAEGALEIALHERPFSLHHSSCLVLGFGRIAKILQYMLQGLGANVTVAARKKSDLVWASAFGADTFSIYELKNHIQKFQIIFNTVPYGILDEDILSQAVQKPLIIDLASRPGGVDFKAAERMNIKAIHALSLPGKVAPVTAGRIICDTILNIISEQEVIE